MEPKQLCRGKQFHRRVQGDWAGTIEGALVIPEQGIRLIHAGQSTRHIRRGRMDIFIDQIEDFVTVVEIKSTDWDKVRMNRKKLLGAHCRQVLKYVDEYLNVGMVNVCAAIIYPKSPDAQEIKDEVERHLHKESLQVMWYDEE